MPRQRKTRALIQSSLVGDFFSEFGRMRVVIIGASEAIWLKDYLIWVFR